MKAIFTTFSAVGLCIVYTQIYTYVYDYTCIDIFFSGMKADLFDKTNPDWAPSLKLGPTQTNGSESSKKRYERT